MVSKLADIFMSLIDLLLDEELFATWIGVVEWFVTAMPKVGRLQIVQVKTDSAANFFGELDIQLGFSNQGSRILSNRPHIIHQIWVFRGYTKNVDNHSNRSCTVFSAHIAEEMEPRDK